MTPFSPSRFQDITVRKDNETVTVGLAVDYDVHEGAAVYFHSLHIVTHFSPSI